MELNNTWRKTAATIYEKPRDSKMLGQVEVDITDVEKFIAYKRKQGIRITITHYLAYVVSQSVAKVPQLNCYINRGKVYQRERVDANVSVLMGEQMGTVIVKDADKLSIDEFATEIGKKIERAKARMNDTQAKNKNLLSKIPWPFRKWFFNFVRWTSHDLGIVLPGIGIKPDAFGSFIISNIGTLGLDIGYGALMPPSNLAFVLFLGKAKKKPVVVNDKIEIRNMLPLSCVLDHRIVDGSHGGMLFRGVQDGFLNVFKNFNIDPQELE